MKKLLFVLLFSPLFTTAQSNLPRFEKDTLYTTSGYKIYDGQTLQLASGTSAAGYFKHIKFHYSMARTDTYILQNSSVLVNKLKSFKSSGPENNSIRVIGTATYKDNKKAEVDFIIDFESATENIAGQASELTIPEEFRNNQPVVVAAETKKASTADVVKKQTAPEDLKKMMVADEIKKLFDLYKAGALTKEEYETRKKKLLDL